MLAQGVTAESDRASEPGRDRLAWDLGVSPGIEELVGADWWPRAEKSWLLQHDQRVSVVITCVFARTKGSAYLIVFDAVVRMIHEFDER